MVETDSAPAVSARDHWNSAISGTKKTEKQKKSP
jgi:hypothetical protein